MPLPVTIIPVAATPVPATPKVSGLVGVLLETLTVSDLAPNEVGEKVTTILQLALTANVAPQVVVLLNCVPVVKAMLEIFIVAVPVFVSATVCVVLDEPIAQLPNDRLVGLKLAAGAVPPPPLT